MDKAACELGGPSLSSTEEEMALPPVLMDGELGGHVVIEEELDDESSDREEAVGEGDDDDDEEEEIDDKNGYKEAAVGEGEEEEEEDDDEELRERLQDESGDEEEEPMKVTNDAPAAGSSRNGIPLVPEPYVPQGEFLEPARFASVGTTTAGFMRVAVVEADPGFGQEIVVLYRYTRFSRTWSGRKGVDVCRRTKLNRLHFVVAATSDPATSLPWAGSSLAPLIYPVFFVKELNELWSSLVASVSIPPRATRVEVMVDVGILRRGDDTPERMQYMRIELEASMQMPWLGYHIGMELLLPEPVVCKRNRDDGEVSQEEDGAPPLKRRRVVAEVAGDECPICLDELETGLAAWPGCSTPHVFHGECLQMNLKESVTCPICRLVMWSH